MAPPTRDGPESVEFLDSAGAEVILPSGLIGPFIVFDDSIGSEERIEVPIQPFVSANVLWATQSAPDPDSPNPTAQPTHFLSALRDVEDSETLMNPEMEAVFPRAQFVDVCDSYAVFPELAAAARLIDRGQVHYREAIRDGFLQRLWQYARGFDIEKDSFPLNFGAPVPIAELHRPHVAGVKTWLRRTKRLESAMTLDVKIGALGGGAGTRRLFEIGTEVTTEGACQTIAAEVSGSATIWRHLDTGEHIYLLSVTGVSALSSAQPIDDDDPRHGCAQKQDLTPLIERLTKAAAVVDADYCHVPAAPVQIESPKVKTKLQMTREREYKAGWRIGLSDALPDIGAISISSRFTHEIEWGIEYKAGPELLGTYPSRAEWPLRWSWSR